MEDKEKTVCWRARVEQTLALTLAWIRRGQITGIDGESDPVWSNRRLALARAALEGFEPDPAYGLNQAPLPWQWWITVDVVIERAHQMGEASLSARWLSSLPGARPGEALPSDALDIHGYTQMTLSQTLYPAWILAGVYCDLSAEAREQCEAIIFQSALRPEQGGTGNDEELHGLISNMVAQLERSALLSEIKPAQSGAAALRV